MTPIINPWWFYGLEIMNNISTLCSIALLTTFLFVLSPILIDIWGDNIKTFAKKHYKKAIIILSIALFGHIFIPSEDTMIKMLIAQNVTYERVEVAADTVEQVCNDIMDLFEDGEGEQ